MKKLILFFIILVVLDSQSAKAQDVIGELFKIEYGPTLVESEIRGTFHLEQDKGKLEIRVFDAYMNPFGAIYDYPYYSAPVSYSFDSSDFSPGVYIVFFEYKSIYGERESAFYKVKK